MMDFLKKHRKNILGIILYILFHLNFWIFSHWGFFFLSLLLISISIQSFSILNKKLIKLWEHLIENKEIYLIAFISLFLSFIGTYLYLNIDIFEKFSFLFGNYESVLKPIIFIVLYGVINIIIRFFFYQKTNNGNKEKNKKELIKEQGEEKNKEIIENEKDREIIKLISWLLFLPLSLLLFLYRLFIFKNILYFYFSISFFWIFLVFLSSMYYNKITEKIKIGKLLKIFKEKIKIVIYIITSLSILGGTIVQFVYLQNIDALRFFSRGQVISDGLIFSLMFIIFLIIIFISFCILIFIRSIKYQHSRLSILSIVLFLSVCIGVFLFGMEFYHKLFEFKSNISFPLMYFFYTLFICLILFSIFFYGCVYINYFFSERNIDKSFLFIVLLEIIIPIGMFFLFGRNVGIKTKSDILDTDKEIYKMVNIKLDNSVKNDCLLSKEGESEKENNKISQFLIDAPYYKNDQYTFFTDSNPNNDKECVLIFPNSKIDYYKNY